MPSNNVGLHDIFTIVRCLRMLSLSCLNIDVLPNSICNLKHLRHLDLSYSSIERLPANVQTLCNLQTLILEGCSNLKELPTNLSKLVNLQHLSLERTTLEKMPSEMGKLRKLRKLTDFFVAKQKKSGSSIKELGQLLHLRESLSIWNLQNVADVQDAFDANLKDKKQIKELFLNWDGNTDDTQHEREVLEKLKPCINVETLDIIGYGGTRFPNWVGNSSFSNMVRLRLAGCKNCTSLPPLGQLPSLEWLWIEGFDEVVAVGLEFYGSDPLMGRPFKSLKAVTFKKMPKWTEWNTDVVGAFPLLKDLQMVECPKLMGFLFPAAPELIGFNLNCCLYANKSHPSENWDLKVEKGFLLKDIKRGSGVLLSSDEVEFAASMSLKSHLQFYGCSSLSSIACSSLESCLLHFLPHFSKITIQICSDLESLCISEVPLLSLRKLKVADCPNLKSLPENMHSLFPSLKELELSSLPQVDSFPEGRLPSTLRSLEIHNLRNLKSNDFKGLQHLTSLRELKIWGCPKLESVPEEGMPSSLEYLEIGDLENLKSLNYKGLQQLNSICHLQIWKCPKLQSMPEEGLPSSLKFLGIFHCSLLAKRCERQTGEDWPKISHIRCITMTNA